MPCSYEIEFKMAITKEIIRACLRDKRDEIESAKVIFRPIEFEDNGNYVFVGVRHVGKSYVLFQRVKQLLASGTGWDEILFVDFEDERLSELEASDLNLLLETHLETYGKKPYIFLDEIQNIPGWDKFVRRLANAKYHIYVTGSNAKMLSKDVATTLGGRFFITDVYPYSFSEYLHANHIELKDGWIDSTIERSEVVRAFNEFFYYGGLPEISEYRNKRKMLSGLYQKIYLGDICTRNSIKNEHALNILIKKLAESVKQPVSFNRLKNIVVSTGYKISVPTVMDYVEYAADSWLLLPVENELSKLADKESNKKYYFIDNGLLNLFLINPETSLLENVVAVQLCRLYEREQVSYFSDTREIDFVVDKVKMAVQVSYSIKEKDTYNREVVPLLSFGESHNDWQLLIVTYDETDHITEKGVDIDVVPAWKWLLSPSLHRREEGRESGDVLATLNL